MMYQILYYNSKVQKFIQGLECKHKALECILFLSQNGNKLDETYSKTRCDHIFKIRLKSQNHTIRIFYAFDSRLLILHAYLKKDQKTRNKELNLALKRYKELVK